MMKLKIENLRGQCYDGASVMSGQKTGVASRIKEINKKSLYTHCYGHALNLCVKDACTNVSCLKNTFDCAFEIVKLVKKSPQRETMLNQLRIKSENKSKSVHAFCTTRWTVRGEVLESIINNHQELMELWENSLKITKETDMKGRILGCQSEMSKFSFLFGCHLGSKILKQTDNLSATLQTSELSAAEGQEIVLYVLQVLKADRSTERFDMFWDLTNQKAKNLDLNEPVLPRKRKIPQRYGDSSECFNHSTVKEMYRQFYFESYDHVINGIKKRFDQPDFQMYAAMQNILLYAIKGKDVRNEMDRPILAKGVSFSQFYADDLNVGLLETQLELLPQIFQDAVHIHEIFTKVRGMSEAQRKLISEVVTLVKLIMIAPATNANSERVFSAMKLVKSYLRSTMSINRLNSLMVMYVHKELLDQVDLISVANQFVGANKRRRNTFGYFTPFDCKTKNKKVCTVDCATQTEI